MALTDEQWEAETRRLQRNSEYWQKRSEELALSQEKKAQDFYRKISEKYDKASRSVQKNIEAWLNRYATNEGISLQEAKRELTKKELKEFRMDVNDYIEKGRTLNYSDEFADELERASVKAHVERLEALQLQMKQQAEELMATEESGLEELLSETYQDGYYHTAYNVQHGLGYGKPFAQLDTALINAVLYEPWAPDGSNFSERIWGKHLPQLVNYLQTDFAQGIIRGDDPKKMINQVAERFDVGKRTAGRLIMTESAYFASKANGDCMNELGVEEYEILATLDNKTSEICRAMDGLHFPMDEYEVGVTAPPFHMWCRTTTMPYFNDEFTMWENRAARDEKDDYYLIPAEYRYEDWKRIFVDKEKTPGEAGLVQLDLQFFSESKTQKEETVLLYEDIGINEWKSSFAKMNAGTSKSETVTVDGVTYKVDNKHVVENKGKYEIEFAKRFSKDYGLNIAMLPQVMYPQNVKTADYLINGIPYDLKVITGGGKSTLSNNVKGKEKQAKRFIFDVTNCKLDDDQVNKQAEKIFLGTHYVFVEELIIVKDFKIVRILKRAQKN